MSDPFDLLLAASRAQLEVDIAIEAASPLPSLSPPSHHDDDVSDCSVASSRHHLSLSFVLTTKE
jgi:hypothetical protein